MIDTKAETDIAGLVDFLRNPSNYPEQPSFIEHRETHISHVFVGDRFAYKIKKAVDFGFLDFTTLEKRYFFCLQEVSLNSRLAPDIYLEVVPIYLNRAGYSFARRSGAHIIEYAVKMKRVPEDMLLYRLVDKGDLLYNALQETGQTLGSFHKRAHQHIYDPYGGIDAIRTNTEENFEQIKYSRGLWIEDRFYESLVAYTHRFLTDYRRVFEERKAHGLVREGHGDLHSRHVCLLHPPIIMDCIEFNKRFRILDVIDDMAFLFMDLEYRGRFDLTSALGDAYFSIIPEAATWELLCFYKAYRAVVRGKIEGFTADSVRDEALRAAAEARAKNYYLLARYYVEECNRPFNPVVLMGPSGSGKSAIGRDLLPGAVVIRSDELRKEIVGLRSDTHIYVDYGSDIYAPDISLRTYGLMTERAVAAAEEGKRVVVDATFLGSRERLTLYERCTQRGLNPFFVYCFADAATLQRRVETRRAAGSDISDAHAAIVDQQLSHAEDPSELPFFRVMRIDAARAAVPDIQKALRLFL